MSVLVVGGGISGLAAAWWLAQAGLDVEVWEAAARPGGKIATDYADGYLTERAASLLLNFRPEVSELIALAGLEPLKRQRAAAAETRRYVLKGGRLQSVPMSMAGLLGSSVLSLRGRLRLLAEPFIPAREDEESVASFIRRRLGRELYEVAIEPFIAGTLASDAERASASATLPRLKGLERRYGSITAGILAHRLLRRRSACLSESFSFRGGMTTLIDTLATAPGVSVLTQHRVTAIGCGQGGWQVEAESPSGLRRACAEHLILALPAAAAAELLADVDRALSKLLTSVDYAPLAVVHLGLRREAVAHPLDGAGFLTPRAAGLPLSGNLWMSALFPDRAPADRVLLTSYLGGARRPEVADWSDVQLIEGAYAALRPLLGLADGPDWARVDRHAQALPLYHGLHATRDVALGERLSALAGLHLEGNYRGGVSLRDRLARGRELATRIVAERAPSVRIMASAQPAWP